MRNMRRIRAVVTAVAASLILLISFGSPASASDQYGLIFGPDGKSQGYYSWVDCKDGTLYQCGNAYDGRMTVDDYGFDGRPIRVRMWAEVNSTWYRYADKWVPNDYVSTFPTGQPPAGAKVRFKICIYKTDYKTVVTCDEWYAINHRAG